MTVLTKTTTEASLIKWRNTRTAKIDRTLQSILTHLAKSQPTEIQRILKAMGHSLLSGGKRLRPLLTLAATEAAGGHEQDGFPGALAVEMIHAYSLIHDDLPALDNDDLRRGLPTCHLAFDEATAILAGDALQTLAFETLTTAGQKRNQAQRCNKAISILAQAIGPLGMVGGQAMDLAFEKKVASQAENKDMEIRKTGELLAACLGLGGALAGATESTLKIFRKMGLLAGEAFQITDDILNQIGDPAILGKAIGTDKARGKTSVVSLFSLDEAREKAQKLIARATTLATGFESTKLVWLFNKMINRAS